MNSLQIAVPSPLNVLFTGILCTGMFLLLETKNREIWFQTTEEPDICHCIGVMAVKVILVFLFCPLLLLTLTASLQIILVRSIAHSTAKAPDKRNALVGQSSMHPEKYKWYKSALSAKELIPRNVFPVRCFYISMTMMH